MTIGEFIKQRREELKISQADLATQLTLIGHSTVKASIGHWERGRNNPPIEDSEFRQALSSVLQIDVNEMVARMGLIKSEFDRSEEARRVADIIDRLPNEGKKLALEIVQTLERRFTSV